MPVTSHSLRVAILVAVLAVVGFGATFAVSTPPANAALQKFYVDDNRNVLDDGDPCLAHAVNYGACYKSISSAINDLDVVAGEVDEVWVDDGAYNETVFINKPVKLVSINGPSTTLISQTNASYVVWIETDPVTFGGPGGGAGDGFTVRQQGAAPGYTLGINGPDVEGDSVTIQNNAFLGTDSLYGIFVDAGIAGGDLVIRDNEIRAQRCFEIATHIAAGSNVEFTHNDCTGFTDTGVYVSSDGSSESVSDGSTLTVSHNTLTGDGNNAYNGIYVEGKVIRGSSMHADWNTVSGFYDTGVYLESIAEGGDLTINDNGITGDDALDGIYVNNGIEYEATGEISRNTVSGITGPPIYVWDTAFGSDTTICNNTTTGGSEGIVLEYLGEGSNYDVCYNTAKDFTFDAIFTGGGPMEGASMNIIGNDMDSDVASWGIYVEEVENGVVVNMENNHIRVSDAIGGIYLYGPEDGSTATIHNNVLNIPDTDEGVDVKQTAISEGSSLTITQNEITGYDMDGILLTEPVDSSEVLIQNNILVGAGTTAGINFEDAIQGGSIVNILNNCISDSVTAIITGDLLNDTSEMHINQNDLADQATAIEGFGSTKTVDAENNFYGSPAGPSGANAYVLGNVDADPWLNSAPSCSGATATPTPSPSPTPPPPTCGSCAVGGAVALSVDSGSETPWTLLAVSLGAALAVLTVGIWYGGRRRLR